MYCKEENRGHVEEAMKATNFEKLSLETVGPEEGE